MKEKEKVGAWRAISIVVLAACWTASAQIAGALAVLYTVRLIRSQYHTASIVAADMDQDGDLDLVRGGTGQPTDRLSWLENADGKGLSWTNHEILPLPSFAIRSLPVDVDGDLDFDIVVLDNSSHSLYWYENLDGQAASWTRHTVASVIALDIVMGDVEGDGDMDFCVSSFDENSITWFENNGSTANWPAHPVATISQPSTVQLADMDLDDDLDVVSGNAAGKITLHLNTDGQGTTWTTQLIASTPVHITDAGIADVDVADLNGDGRPDVLMAFSRGDLLWVENASPDLSVWTKRLVDDASGRPGGSLAPGDFDLDGDIDIAWSNTTWLGWYDNSDGVGTSWTGYGFTSIFFHYISTADIDGDGDLDLLCADDEFNRTYWIDNRIAPVAEVTYGGTVVPDQGGPVDLGFQPQDGPALNAVFTVTNIGQLDLVTSDLTVTAPYAISDDLSTTLTIGASDTFTIDLGTATPGTFPGMVGFGVNEQDDSETTFSLTARIIGSVIEWSPSSLDFGIWNVDDGPTSAATVSIENTGYQPLNFTGTGIEIIGADASAFLFSDSPSTAPLAVGNSRLISVQYDPGTTTSQTAWLRFTTDDVEHPEVLVDMVGEGTNYRNYAPTDISLSNQSIDENSPQGTVIGVLTSSDPNVGEMHSYSFEPPYGDGGGPFVINGDQLQVANRANPNYEVQSSYNVTIRSTDNGITVPLSYDESFVITINDLNEAPTNISLSAAWIGENYTTGTLIGLFSTDDQDPADTHVYTFTAPNGDGGGAVSIVGDELRLAAPSLLDFPADSPVLISVRSTEQRAEPLFYEKNIALELERFAVLDLNGPDAGVSYDTVFRRGDRYTFLAHDRATLSDPDGTLNSLTVRLLDRPDGLAESLNANTVDTHLNSSFDAGSGILTISGANWPVERYQKVLRTVAYQNNAAAPTGAIRRIEITADPDRLSARAQTRVTILNDPNLPTIFTPSKLIPDDVVGGSEVGFDTAIDGNVLVIGSDSAAYIYEREGGVWHQKVKVNRDTVPWSHDSVVVDGDTVVIGSDSGGWNFSGELFIYVRGAEGWTQQANLGYEDTGDLGFSVDLDGDRLVAGDMGRLDTAWVFERRNGIWERTTQLFGGDDQYGRAVAVQGDTIAVGAPYESYGGVTRGAVHIYELEDGNWTERAVLSGEQAETLAIFGCAVDLDGDTLVVGARDDYPFVDRGTGEVYVFVRDGDTWTQQTRLAATDGFIDGAFGSDVRLQGERLIVGGPGGYIYDRVQSRWVEHRRFFPFDAYGQEFGADGALSGDLLLFGAPGDDERAPDAGAAYLYEATRPALIIRDPRDQAVALGEEAQFAVQVVGSPPITYQWFKDGAPLADDARIAGAQTSWLRIAAATGADQGVYDCEVSNAEGADVSSTASLTLNADGLRMLAEPLRTTGLSNTVGWTPVDGATTYSLQVAANEDFTALVDEIVVDAAASTHTVEGLLDEMTYWYRARAFFASSPASSWALPVFSTQDAAVPHVLSLKASNPGATSAQTVSFELIFSEPVTGLGSEDLSLLTDGLVGASIIGIEGSGGTYHVDVDTGSGGGTLSLALDDHDSIADHAGNLLGGVGVGNGDATSSDGYSIQKAPGVDLNGSRAGVDVDRQLMDRVPAVFAADPDVALMDLPGEPLDRLEAKLIDPLDGAAEYLTVVTSGTLLSSSWHPLSATLVIEGLGTPTEYQDVLRSLRYHHSGPVRHGASRIIEVVALDGAEVGIPAECRIALVSAAPSLPNRLDLATSVPQLMIYPAEAGDDLGGFEFHGGAILLDFNGDGITDVLTGASNADGPSNQRGDAGEAYVFFGDGRLQGIRDIGAKAGPPADVHIYGVSAGDELTFNSAMYAADLNGDGIDDIVLGAWRADGPGGTRIDAGAAYIIFGRPNPPPVIDLAQQAPDVTIHGKSADNVLTRFGSAIRSGDFNHDGRQDLVLGSYLEAGQAGECYIIYGASTWPAVIDLANGDEDVLIRGTGQSWITAFGAMDVGDFNGDGVDDLAFAGTHQTPLAFVILGQQGGMTSFYNCANDDEDMRVTGVNSPSNYFSSTVYLMDLDGDGRDELFLTNQRIRADYRSTIYVIYGSASPPSNLLLANGDEDARLILPDPNEVFIIHPALPKGDFNGDELNDLILQAEFADGPGNSRRNCGEAYVFHGSPTRLSGSITVIPGACDVFLYGPAVDGILATNAIGDWNHDGVMDLLLGSPLYDYSGRDNGGQATILYGGQWPSVIDLSQWTPRMEIFANADSLMPLYAHSADINGDGSDDILTGAEMNGPDPARPMCRTLVVMFGESGSLPFIDLNGGSPGADASLSMTARGSIDLVPDAVTSDQDSDHWTALTLQLTDRPDGENEWLSTDVTGTSITAQYETETGRLVLNGLDTVANYQLVLRRASYHHGPGPATNGLRTIEIAVHDGGWWSPVGEVSLSGEWPAQYQLSASVSPPGSGSVMLADGVTPADGTWHDQDALVTIRAIPGDNSVFAGWSGDVTGDDPETSLTMSTGRSVVALFSVPPVVLTYLAGEHGTIAGTTPQTVNHGGDGTPVEAIPDTGYHFVQWSDGSTQNPRTDTNVMTDVTVTAIFSLNQRTYVRDWIFYD